MSVAHRDLKPEGEVETKVDAPDTDRLRLLLMGPPGRRRADLRSKSLSIGSPSPTKRKAAARPIPPRPTSFPALVTVASTENPDDLNDILQGIVGAPPAFPFKTSIMQEEFEAMPYKKRITAPHFNEIAVDAVKKTEGSKVIVDLSNDSADSCSDDKDEE